MYMSAHDEHRALAVWSLSSMSDAEWKHHFDDMARLTTWQKPMARRPAVLLLLGGGFSRPDAKKRLRLAEASDAPGYDPYLAIVTQNPVARGLLTVLSWTHTKPKYVVSVFGDTASARAWLEEQRGEPLPELDRLLRGLGAPDARQR